MESGSRITPGSSQLELGQFVFTTDKTISPVQLLPGDLLFTCQDKTSEHVSIVTYLKEGSVREVHEVNSTQGWRGLHENDVNLTSGFFVFRCKDQDLAKKAAYWAQRWVLEFPAPFAIHRYAMAVEYQKRHADDFVPNQRELFNKCGKFRAIKYAARRNGGLIYPGEKDPRIKGNRGMFCSMFVVLCYQVAGLAGLVDPAPPGLRVSDKKMDEKDMKRYRKRCAGSVDTTDLHNFEMYLGHLKEIDPYKLDVENPQGTNKKWLTRYRPSLEYWKSKTSNVEGCNWPNIITKGMMVDAKVILPMGLLASLVDDEETWSAEGWVQEKPVFSESKLEKFNRMTGQQAKIDKRFS